LKFLFCCNTGAADDHTGTDINLKVLQNFQIDISSCVIIGCSSITTESPIQSQFINALTSVKMLMDADMDAYKSYEDILQEKGEVESPRS
jgi:hypothetical protein